MVNDDEFVVHNELMQLMRSTAMSSDESDSDEVDSLRFFQTIAPAWRSQELGDFLHSIDEQILQNRRPRIGHRAVRGAEPRRRKHTLRVNEESVAPPSLPSNCYDSAWLASLRKGEQKLLQVRKDVKYNFSTGTTGTLTLNSSHTSTE